MFDEFPTIVSQMLRKLQKNHQSLVIKKKWLN